MPCALVAARCPSDPSPTPPTAYGASYSIHSTSTPVVTASQFSGNQVQELDRHLALVKKRAPLGVWLPRRPGATTMQILSSPDLFVRNGGVTCNDMAPGIGGKENSAPHTWRPVCSGTLVTCSISPGRYGRYEGCTLAGFCTAVLGGSRRVQCLQNKGSASGSSPGLQFDRSAASGPRRRPHLREQEVEADYVSRSRALNYHALTPYMTNYALPAPDPSR